MNDATDSSATNRAFDADDAERVLFLGAVVSIVADGEDTGGALTVTEIDAPTGYENNLHAHSPGELFYVLSGEMTLYVDGDTVRLTPGTTGFVPGGSPHGFRVVGDAPLRVLALFAPAGMAAFFREAGTPVDSRVPPAYDGPTDEELDRMVAAGPKHGIERLGPLPPAE